MLIQRAHLLDGTVADIRTAHHVVEVALDLVPAPGESVFDASGCTVIPGLHDHHVHVHSAAAATTSVNVGPRQVHDHNDFRAALATASIGDDGWVRAVGYHEAVAGELDRTALDALSPPVPVRVQHRSGIMWTLNSAGLARVGLPDHPDGRLRSADPSWSGALARRETGLADVSRRLASYGVTGLTDATPDLGVEDVVRFAEARRHGELLQRVHCLAPGKRILHDDDLDLDELTSWIADRHAAGAIAALHCVTAAQLVVTIAALRAAGTRRGDRIEHAAVVPDDCVGDLVELGVGVVTQPNFVAERGDQYLGDVPPDEHHQLWRVASLLAAGIPLALSTDFPFGESDPWAAMRAAVRRTTSSGVVLGDRERIPARTALTAFLGAPEHLAIPRAVRPGEPADLCLLAAPPAEVLRELDAELVAATVVEGRVVYERP
ncbi:amidohydrolase [Mycobacterium antarcticum]|uniref:amidohydrolase family protein n=1 Tax=unclassified Mycolicibacterium TaxID=2636767 RepID=UPI00239A7F14|nr:MULTISPECIES: amidohydrolase family protein [unclassified Mycolicibacterium]BDX34871.1 amidohydrolase [Mycolicibacterium sp. TUM20985]GLP78072.1 amidohydrolase [Mycolicibacterium sp. TUM20983]GLP81145.1 amidohydrolase [Mycolicibacterium sp. TUM20984]